MAWSKPQKTVGFFLLLLTDQFAVFPASYTSINHTDITIWRVG